MCQYRCVAAGAEYGKRALSRRHWQDEPFSRENEGDDMKVWHDAWVRTMRYELFVDWIMPVVGLLGIGTALALNRQRAEVALQMFQGWAQS
jgi:hypothetical protein